MRKSRFSVEQIVAAIKQTEMGMPVTDLCRKLGVSEPTYYCWKKLYGSLEPDQAREFLELFLVGLDEFLELLGRSTRRRVAHEALRGDELGVELRIGNELADFAVEAPHDLAGHSLRREPSPPGIEIEAHARFAQAGHIRQDR